jgi:hypothetical protein
MSRRGEMEGVLGEGLRRQADERLIGEPRPRTRRWRRAFGSERPRPQPSAQRGGGLGYGSGQGRGPGFSDKPFDQNYQLAKDQEDALARQNPKSALAGPVGGIGAGMVFLPALGGASTLARRAGQAALTGAGYGAAAEFADTKDLGRTATAGAIGGTLGAVAQPIAEKAVGVIAGLTAKGFPSRNQAGELTTTAKTMLSRAGVDPAAIDAQLDDAISATFSRKGIPEAAAREAAAGEFGIPLTRGQATQDAAQLRLPTTTALPSGTTEPVEAMRRARGAFADYQKTFKPQRTGDDVGRALQRIVERDASAGDVALMLYGAGKIGKAGKPAPAAAMHIVRIT